jgi:hypothetical protein
MPKNQKTPRRKLEEPNTPIPIKKAKTDNQFVYKVCFILAFLKFKVNASPRSVKLKEGQVVLADSKFIEGVITNTAGKISVSILDCNARFFSEALIF